MCKVPLSHLGDGFMSNSIEMALLCALYNIYQATDDQCRVMNQAGRAYARQAARIGTPGLSPSCDRVLVHGMGESYRNDIRLIS